MHRDRYRDAMHGDEKKCSDTEVGNESAKMYQDVVEGVLKMSEKIEKEKKKNFLNCACGLVSYYTLFQGIF